MIIVYHVMPDENFSVSTMNSLQTEMQKWLRRVQVYCWFDKKYPLKNRCEEDDICNVQLATSTFLIDGK